MTDVFYKIKSDLFLLAQTVEQEKGIDGFTQTASKAVKLLETSEYLSVVSDFLSSIELINDENVTFLHSLEVGLLCLHFQPAMEDHLDASFSPELLLVGGLIHDIGKIKTPLIVLNKPGKLSDS